MKEDLKQRVEQALAHIEEEYRKKYKNLFVFLFSYFYPRIDTKSDYITDSKGRYLCLCHFVPSGKKSAKEHLELFAQYFGIDTRVARFNFSAYIDIASAKIPNTCTDEEYGDHYSFYGADTDYYFLPVKTELALADRDVRAVVEEKQGCEYTLVTKVMEMLQTRMGGEEKINADLEHKAQLYLDKVKECEEQLASALYCLGEVYEQMDDLGAAIEVWQRAYAIWHDIEEANPEFSNEAYDELTDRVSDLLETEIDGYD